jgi:hypothetical protein
VLAGFIFDAHATGIEKPDTPKAEVGSCGACGGLPAGKGETDLPPLASDVWELYDVRNDFSVNPMTL